MVVAVAVYHWIKALFGLWIVWVVFSMLGVYIGFIWGTTNYIVDAMNSTGITIPSPIRQGLDNIYTYFTSIWNWIALIIFGAFIFYIYINSMRRDVDEYTIAY